MVLEIIILASKAGPAPLVHGPTGPESVKMVPSQAINLGLWNICSQCTLCKGSEDLCCLISIWGQSWNCEIWTFPFIHVSTWHNGSYWLPVSLVTSVQNRAHNWQSQTWCMRGAAHTDSLITREGPDLQLGFARYGVLSPAGGSLQATNLIEMLGTLCASTI